MFDLLDSFCDETRRNWNSCYCWRLSWKPKLLWVFFCYSRTYDLKWHRMQSPEQRNFQWRINVSLVGISQIRLKWPLLQGQWWWGHRPPQPYLLSRTHRQVYRQIYPRLINNKGLLPTRNHSTVNQLCVQVTHDDRKANWEWDILANLFLFPIYLANNNNPQPPFLVYCRIN